MDGRRADAPRAQLPDEDRRQDRDRDDRAAQVQAPIDSLEHVAATKLELNEIGVCDLELDQPIAFDPYAENRDTGGFILIDRITNNTVGAGPDPLRAAPVAEHPLAGADRRQVSARG